ncbi:MAG TPA: calcium-binding protein [Allosphingosinicella sp.]|nr:calcium-binding protein [Allosphingosinicella sp.]
MAYINGTNGSDTLQGTDQWDSIRGEGGDDFLYGLGGDDVLYDGLGDDLADGGVGNDRIESREGGSDTLIGGDGDDRIYVSRASGLTDTISATGGTGKDSFEFSLYGASIVVVDAGEGDDNVRISAYGGTYGLTLGNGRDIVSLWSSLNAGTPPSITITDFQAGDAGDRLDFSNFLTWGLSNWDHNQNPFASGHLRLVQAGGDTRLDVDTNGGGNGFVTLITFTGADASAFTYLNLHGFPADGSVPAGLTITGDQGRDELVGTAGNDTIYGLGEEDRIEGGSGDDTIDGGDGRDIIMGEGGDDIVDGGDGDDFIDTGYGDDIARGGDGNDVIESRWGGNELLQGEAGNDGISIQRSGANTDLVRAEGGGGNDRFHIAAYGANNRFELDGGAGDDIVTLLWVQGLVDITFGAGRDLISLEDTQQVLLRYGSVIIRDFELGAAGDQLNFDGWLSNVLTGWDGASNPFGTGHVRLLQNGADTLLQVDHDGIGSLSDYRTIITFTNRDAGDFTADNLDGFPSNGSAPQGKVLIGTDAGETLTGTAGDDTIEGRGGSDTLIGGGGADLMFGGAGFDRLEGGTGDDILHGEGDADLLNGQEGDDLVYGGEGADTIQLGHGADLAYGGSGNDAFYFYQAGASGKSSALYGEEGDDLISIRSYNAAHLVADAGAGADRIYLGAITGTLILTLGAGADQIFLEGDFLNNPVPDAVTITDFQSGTDGDSIAFGTGLAAFTTGWDGASNPFATGHLRLVQSGANTLIQIDRNGGGDGWQTIFKLENLAAATLGTASIGYEPGAVRGTAGADLMGGSSKDDVLIGGAGDDIYDVDSLADQVVEDAGGGTDTVRTAAGSRSDHNQLYVLQPNVENLIGTAANGQGVRGNALANVITMAGGNDLIVLDDGGDDTVSAGGGNDFIYFGGAWTAADKVDGGAGTDTVALLGNYTITLGEGHLTGVERLALYTGQHAPGGTAHNYRVTVSDAALAAKTEFYVSAASLKATETLIFDGSAETDARLIVIGGAGNDTLAGGARPDYLGGGAGNDALYGLGGNDALAGGLGADLLDGGAGHDWFQYTDAAESTSTQFDTIRRFEASGDRVDLPFTVTGWSGDVTGSLSFQSFDADVAAAVDQALLGYSAVLFRPDAGTYAGRTFVVIDGNGDGVYTAGLDYLIEFANQFAPIAPGAPIFI